MTLQQISTYAGQIAGHGVCEVNQDKVKNSKTTNWFSRRMAVLHTPSKNLTGQLIRRSCLAVAITIMMIAIATFSKSLMLTSAILGALCLVANRVLSKPSNLPEDRINKTLLTDPPVDVSADVIEQKPLSNPSDVQNVVKAQGGFKNGGNTCFIAAALQTLRQIPIVRERLNPNNYKLEKVSDEKLEISKQIQQTIYDLFEQADQGVTASGQALIDLRALFFKFKPDDEFQPNIMGDPDIVLRIITSILDIRYDEIGFHNHKGDVYTCINRTTISNFELDHFLQTCSQENFIQITIEPSGEQEKPYFWKRYPQLQLIDKNNPSKTLTYEAMSVIICQSYHAMSYIKNGQGGWIKFNDAHVSAVEEIPQETPILDPYSLVSKTHIIIYSR